MNRGVRAQIRQVVRVIEARGRTMVPRWLMPPRASVVRIARNAFVIGDQGANSIANFAITLFLVRKIGIADFGVFAIYYLIALNAVAIMSGMITLPMVSVAYKNGAESKRKLLTTACTLIASTGGLFTVIGLAASWVWPLLNQTAPMNFAALGALTCSMLLAEFMRRLFFLLARRGAVGVLDAGRYGAMAIIFGTSALKGWHWGPLNYLAAMAVCNLALVAALCLLHVRAARENLTFEDFGKQTRRIFKAGKWLSMSSALQFINDYLLVLLASGTLGPFVVGIVRTCQSLVGVINPIFMALEHIIPRWLGIMFAEVGSRAAIQIYRRAAVGIFCACAVTLGGLAALSRPILVLVAGEKAADYNWMLQALCLALLITLGFLLVAFVFRAFERTRPIFLSLLAGSLVTLLIGTQALKLLGAPGIAVGAVLAPLAGLAVLGGAAWHDHRTAKLPRATTEMP